ncbi:SDR family NAD(P)-dependent oxidoreductase [Blastomonas sp.]|uniref:SDR family NAD(P)-dependent oxidoreductase n=1 Tax=Blastomonas sp. TaxID=1909299 RepID=UPI0035948B70
MTRTVIITGASSGIGRATALRMARGGYHVVATGRSQQRGFDTVRAVQAAGGTAEFHSFDVTSESEWTAFADIVTARHASVDALINSAGTFFSKSLPDTTLEAFRDLWTADVESVVLGTKYGLRMMRDTRTGGSIVNISSLAGLIGLEDCAAYCAAKAAVTHFSRVAALEGAQLDPKVRVNSLNPGVIYTEMITGAYGDSDAVKAFVMDGNALQRVGTAEDIASAAAFLASDASRMVTGTAMLVDGGRGAD